MRWACGVVLAVMVAVSGCGGPAPQSSPAAVSPPPGEATNGGQETAVREPAAGEPMEELTGNEQNSVQPSPTWDEKAESAAADRAAGFMRAFARPDLPNDQWHAGIAGFMTDQGAQIFAYVDPANVPVSSVQGAEVLPNVSASLAEVQVDTDAGPYLVTMIRTTTSGPWLVEYAAPVE